MISWRRCETCPCTKHTCSSQPALVCSQFPNTQVCISISVRTLIHSLTADASESIATITQGQPNLWLSKRLHKRVVKSNVPTPNHTVRRPCCTKGAGLRGAKTRTHSGGRTGAYWKGTEGEVGRWWARAEGWAW